MNAIVASDTLNNGIWFSTDGGENWLQSNIIINNWRKLYMVGTNAIASGGIQKGCWYSSDSGQNWYKSNMIFGDTASICMEETNAVICPYLDWGITFLLFRK